VSSTIATDETLARQAMVSFVGALADNKAALGRRYGEWAVSAPTLESAVAAAAMAQDELGHARSTYPVLKALGAEPPDERTFGGDHRLALLDGELPDWASFIAANLLIDGVLTTFVAACVDSSQTQMAQRARKILQEEGSHRIHAEAWAKRLCRSGDGERKHLLARLVQTWEQAGRWAGRHHTTVELGEPLPRLPVLQLRRGRADRPVGWADDHRPVALSGLRLLLRGRARGLRPSTTIRPGQEALSGRLPTRAALSGRPPRLSGAFHRREVLLGCLVPQRVALLKDGVRA
jgi:ring-1,2-phenylacetyl-CoA epoxidase subunit PaaC